MHEATQGGTSLWVCSQEGVSYVCSDCASNFRLKTEGPVPRFQHQTLLWSDLCSLPRVGPRCTGHFPLRGSQGTWQTQRTHPWSPSRGSDSTDRPGRSVCFQQAPRKVWIDLAHGLGLGIEHGGEPSERQAEGRRGDTFHR